MFSVNDVRQRCTDRPAPLRAAGMLLVGAASRNAGKTTLACALVQAVARSCPVAAVKVTIVRDDGHGCPRGDEGCGVCERLDVPFRLTEQVGEPDDTDTGRLLAAGARPVLWLCARPETLASAARALVTALATPMVPACFSASYACCSCFISASYLRLT